MDNTNDKERFDTWLKETSNGLLAVALKKTTGKSIRTIVDTRAGRYTDFVYENMRIHRTGKTVGYC